MHHGSSGDAGGSFVHGLILEWAEKIEFISGPEKILDFFDASNLLSWYGGSDKYEYAYIPPNDRDIPVAMPDSEWRQLKLATETEKTRFIDLTLQASLDPQNQDLEQQRNQCKDRLLSSYRKIDKHSLAGSFYHRIGIISREDGTVDWTRARHHPLNKQEQLYFVHTPRQW